MVLRIRSARSEDAAAVAALIDGFAARNLMLPRRAADVAASLPDWRVAVARAADGSEGILGCGALVALTPQLAELRSLAVHTDAHGQGIGGRLVKALMALARAREFDQVCALTLRESFFRRHGFETVDRWQISPKIWQECIYFPKFARCDEVAVLSTLRTPAGRVGTPAGTPAGNPLQKWPAWHALRLAYCHGPSTLQRGGQTGMMLEVPMTAQMH